MSNKFLTPLVSKNSESLGEGKPAKVALLALLLIFCLLLPGCKPKEPRINQEFPIKEPGNLSPPGVKKPIHNCAEAVHVYGFVPKATVKVYAGGSELIGQAVPDFGFTDIQLTRAVSVGESITATQTVEGVTSGHSVIPVIVSDYLPGGFNKPKVGEDLYDCGVIVPVGELVESVKVKVLADQNKVGEANSPHKWIPVWTQPLQAGQKVTAFQVACEGSSSGEKKSPESEAVQVKPIPSPVPTPAVGSTIVGNDTVDLFNLLVGAKVTVYDNGAVVGGGYATASANWAPIDPPVSAGSSITAKQELCGKQSPESPPGDVVKELRPPILLEPICDGQQFVIIRDTVINASVFVKSNGVIVGYGGAVAGDLILALSSPLKAGDVVVARQYMGMTVSPSSNQVTVIGALEKPVVEILGSELFFQAEPGELQIDGPVFPRGRGAGPFITVLTCCDKDVHVEIMGVDGGTVTEVEMTEQFPGYFTGHWGWSSNADWAIPKEIPVGEYTADVKSDCELVPVKKKFYVIFDPQEVTAPGRFSFNETGVWFGPREGADRGLSYTLHPDDRRVFDRAIKEINGETNPFKASEKLLKFENTMFAYSLNYHGADVIHLIENETSAQCADDANMLVALLRSVGIPSHPVTVDAALEYGSAGWNFDTWLEARLDGPSGELWYALHPHQGSGIGPDTRATAGAGGGLWGVATKYYNDVAIMANQHWVGSELNDSNDDLQFGYDTPCKEPNQNFTYKANWIDHLCANHPDGGYWGTGHWTCSPAWTSDITITLGKEVFFVGDEMRIKVEVKNRAESPIKGRLRVMVAVDDPYSKLYPDKRLEVAEKAMAVNPEETQTLWFDFRLPTDLSASDEYAVIASFDEKFNRKTFDIEALYKAALTLPDEIIVNKPFTVELQIINARKVPVEGVTVKLSLPFGIKEPKISLERKFEALESGQTEKIKWELYPQAPNEAAAFIVDIQSNNGGRVKLSKGAEIKPDGRRAPGEPSTLLVKEK